MAIKYKSLVPWGRSYEEYVDMFNLNNLYLNKSILGCGDGPACFNSVMYKNDKKVVSIDPIYQFTADQIEQRIHETYETVISQTKNNMDKFIWTKIKDPNELGEIRMSAMKQFLLDYETGKKQQRYIHAELPELPFNNKQFDLSLSSHFLFLYTDNLSLDFHIKSIREMLRVSYELRIFPLLDINSNSSPYLEKVIEEFSEEGYFTEIIKVNYEFQKGGNLMLRIDENKL